MMPPRIRGVLVAFISVLVAVAHAELYADGSCPIFALLPFTSRYVVTGKRRGSTLVFLVGRRCQLVALAKAIVKWTIRLLFVFCSYWNTISVDSIFPLCDSRFAFRQGAGVHSDGWFTVDSSWTTSLDHFFSPGVLSIL